MWRARGCLERASVETVLRVLLEAKVRYLVAGGLAVNAHGYLRDTKDIDLVIELSPENAFVATTALAGLGYRPAVPVALEDFADARKRDAWIRDKGAQVLNLHSDRHPTAGIDLFIAEPFDFDRAYADGLEASIEGVRVRAVGLDDLIQMKQLAGRPRDLVDLRQLEQIRKRICDEEV